MIPTGKNEVAGLVAGLEARIHAALPQTQCTRCGYPDCAAYAQAIAKNAASINQCPPGGSEGVHRLAAITGLPVIPLNPENGTESPRFVALIDENWCIGCTLCLPVCPTDAIVGSNKLMHTVMEAICTGCELCIPVCPVDCISLENITGDRTGWQAWSQTEADTARGRYIFHSYRLMKIGHSSPESATNSGTGSGVENGDEGQPITSAEPTRPPVVAAIVDQKRSVIDAALARARARRPNKL